LKSVLVLHLDGCIRSLPTRERGLKSWSRKQRRAPSRVAPYTGAWIEIIKVGLVMEDATSLPTRERGLK